MNKQQYLDALRHFLSDLPPKEIEESVNYYAEMIDDRTEAGKIECHESSLGFVNVTLSTASGNIDYTSGGNIDIRIID